jgi:ELWxxDGT repeat protein
VRRLILLPLLVWLWTPPGAAQPYLVKDINPLLVDQSSSPDRFVHFGRYAVFSATTLLEGRELWSSDGTAAGTFLLVDACPGECYSDPTPVAVTPRGVFFNTFGSGEGARNGLWITRGTPASTMLLAENVQAGGGASAVWMASQGVLYFSGLDSAHGIELWRSDGTPAGTYPVKDLWPGPSGAMSELAVYRGRVFFGASDGATGWALWSSDGTAAGTKLVKDPSPNTLTNEPGLRWLRATTGYLFFEANGTAGRELWRSDGTTAGTRLVADLTPGPGSTSIYNAVALGNRVFLEAESGAQGEEVWVSDGTPRGTKALTHFAESRPFTFGPSRDRSLSAANVIGNQLIFPAFETGLGRELWTTDGTTAGTHLLTDLCPGSCSAVLSVWPAFQNRIYFSAADQRGLELWVTDGTAAGTHLVRDLCLGACSSFPADPFPLGGALLFTAKDAAGHRQLWKTDGTAAGTIQLSSFAVDNFAQGLQGAVTTTGKLFFAADDGVHGSELWLTDGTSAGTRLAANLDAADHGGSRPFDLMAAGGTLYFFADDGVHGSELWKSDGTANGTELVHEFLPGPGTLERLDSFDWRADLGGTLAFIPALGLSNSLWRTDGTDAGTYALTSDDVQVRGYPDSRRLPVVNGKAFFLASRQASGRELWVTDGTPAGTQELDLVPGAADSSPSALTPYGNKLVFTAGTPSSPQDRRLWTSDGTAAGTTSVTDAVQPTLALTVHQGLVYFLGTAGGNTQLWRSDGTAAGTVRLPDIVPGRSLEAQALTSLGSRLLLWGAFPFSADQKGLWATDGTAAGTKRLRDVNLLFSFSDPQELGGVLYFVGGDGHADLLWRTDGTEAGTHPLRDHDGHTIATPYIMSVFDGKLYFITPDIGATLWQSDGTPQGTVPLRQLDPGQPGSLALAVAGSRLFFRAFDPATGSELWAIGGH